MEEPVLTRYIFVFLLAVADPEGYVDGTDIALARKLNLTPEEFAAGLAPLLQPDPKSKSRDLDGRRIVPSDTGCSGYLIVNFLRYRNIQTPADRRVYMREYMRRRRLADKACKQPIETEGAAQTAVAEKSKQCKLSKLLLTRVKKARISTDKKQPFSAPKNVYKTCTKPAQTKAENIPGKQCKHLFYQLTHADADADIRKREREISPKISPSAFSKPTMIEVEKRADEIQLPVSEAHKFFHFYESKGWRVGKDPMKSWRSALAGWRVRWLDEREKHATCKRSDDDVHEHFRDVLKP